jgi:uncharacterized repeat protein (TIGR03803 family)
MGHKIALICGIAALLSVFGTGAQVSAQQVNVQILYSFTGGADGAHPYAGLVQSSDGNFYGTTSFGGAGCNTGCGTIFTITPSGSLTTLFTFNSSNGAYPLARLVQGSDGNFYGNAYVGGSYGSGTVFKLIPSGSLTPNASLTTLFSFNSYSSVGGFPNAELVEGRDGNFYGTNLSTPTYGGSVFKISPSGTFETLVNFNGSNGSLPFGGLIQGTDGNFYGTTSNNNGTVFKMLPNGNLTTLATFNGSNGRNPGASLVQGSDGNFYGMTLNGGNTTACGSNGCGTIFKMTPSGSLKTLAIFNGTNGSAPYASLIQGSDGNFYGTTQYGGTGFDPNASYPPYSGYGTVFKMKPDGTITTLFAFDGVNGSNPQSTLVQTCDRSFYGTTNLGGSSNNGTIFHLIPGQSVSNNVVAQAKNCPVPCGDERDKIIAEYKQYKVYDITKSRKKDVLFVPSCADFTQSAHSVYYSFNNLNVSDNGIYSWALIRYPLVAPSSTGFGLDKWVELIPPEYKPDVVPKINSGYRSPAKNKSVGGTPGSRHMFGDAIDLQNISGTIAEYKALANAAKMADKSFIEPLTGPCQLACVHTDWRDKPGSYSP